MAAKDMAVYMAERRKKRREQLIEKSGGKCVKCGSTDDLNFDHKDAKERSFRLTGKALDRAWEAILEEWRKCQLLCRACHLVKTRENDEFGEAWNKGKSKDGTSLPEHGCESAYARGCRCEACCKAKYEGRLRRGEVSGVEGPRGPNSPRGVIRHGTRSGYQAELRQGLKACDECRKANAEAKADRKKNLMADTLSR